ncbi:tetratricopeptide repeat protein [Nafulsella turpanensis]|uniref:tetratricopeptide repeat protein n=1 Tax=Nafulsella turpanensis TaxID=1265690 RepID=UPI0003459A81|nr:tetratricopeptide repeat protein [Nafulsella turpanensis]
MNKSHFIEFVENPAKLKARDADILAELARNYPYSSLVHILQAKALQQTDKARTSLATAALYIPDRSVLKMVMENTLVQPKNEAALTTPPYPEEGEHKPVKVPVAIITKESTAEKPVAESSVVPEIPERAGVLEELQENLRKLREQREKFTHQDEVSGEASIQETGSAADDTHIRKKVHQPLPERLQEIIENREEQEIDDPKRKEQINLIDSFIQNSSAIARKYRSMDDQKQAQDDLTSHYSLTPHDLATENLAQIMVRQGKTEKAIDIYEKLILKYPQKKAYFASCIEKLKTSL